MDHYKTLGVDQNASLDEIKRAFRKKALSTHPDRRGGDQEEFKRVNEAYAVLSDSEKRAAYDHGEVPMGMHDFDAFDIFSRFFNRRDPFRDFFDDDDFFGSKSFGHDPFSHNDFFSERFSRGSQASFSGTSISTTTTIHNGKRVTKTTKTVRYPDGRIETHTEDSSSAQPPKIQYGSSKAQNSNSFRIGF